MTVQIDIDDATLAEVDAALKILNENREDVFRQTFRELARKKKREAEVSSQYAAAYRSNPVTTNEFEIDEEQLIEVWKDL